MDIKISFPGGKRVNAEFNRMSIQTDQPVKYGGTGLYPEPFMHFLASLGTCAGFYILSFCQSRDITTDGMEIVQSHVYDKTPEGKMQLSKIQIKIYLPASFPEKYKDALLRTADQCAVKKAILNPPLIEVLEERA